MQFNQPSGTPAFENSPYNVHYPTIPIYSQIIGEGEINSILVPDGSVQMYFIPTVRYDRWSPYPHTDYFNANKSAECWFVRSVTLPISTSFHSRLPNIYGDHLSTQVFSPDYNTNFPFSPEYYQKFHNDNSTSTTDILYFYPSLRLGKTLQNNALTQTSTPTAKYNISLDGMNNRACNCKVSFRLEQNEMNDRCVCQESASAMSVDGVNNRSSQQCIDKIKYQRSKNKNQSHRRKRRDHICGCNMGAKDTSDKLVTTYADRASGNVHKEGRDTQTTQKSKRSDIKTEIWVPIKKKSRTKSSTSISTLDECASCINTDYCACIATDTDDE